MGSRVRWLKDQAVFSAHLALIPNSNPFPRAWHHGHDSPVSTVGATGYKYGSREYFGSEDIYSMQACTSACRMDPFCEGWIFSLVGVEWFLPAVPRICISFATGTSLLRSRRQTCRQIHHARSDILRMMDGSFRVRISYQAPSPSPVAQVSFLA